MSSKTLSSSSSLFDARSEISCPFYLDIDTLRCNLLSIEANEGPSSSPVHVGPPGGLVLGDRGLQYLCHGQAGLRRRIRPGLPEVIPRRVSLSRDEAILYDFGFHFRYLGNWLLSGTYDGSPFFMCPYDCMGLRDYLVKATTDQTFTLLLSNYMTIVTSTLQMYIPEDAGSGVWAIVDCRPGLSIHLYNRSSIHPLVLSSDSISLFQLNSRRHCLLRRPQTAVESQSESWLCLSLERRRAVEILQRLRRGPRGVFGIFHGRDGHLHLRNTLIDVRDTVKRELN